MLKTILSGIYFFSILFLFAACGDMNDINREYLLRGESIYTGAVDSISSAPGFNKVWFRWRLNADPRITKTVIYWNDSRDSTVVAIDRAINQPDYHETTFAVAEGSYVFKFVSKDDYGNKSVNAGTSEASVNIYGERYRQGLHARGISSVDPTRIVWYNAETTTLYTTVTYTDTNGAHVVLRIENEEMETSLPDAASGITVIIVTTFLPAGGLDEVESPPRTLTL
jgi:hypothetical protein